jgi:cell wall-associated NlpC family hydrolase
MPQARGVSGWGVASIATGALFVFAGLRGVSVLATLQAVIQGKPISSLPQTNPVAGDVGSAAAAIAAAAAGAGPGVGAAAGTIGSAGIGVIAAERAKTYVGAGYVFGGAPAHGIGNWDCSSFMNWLWGHDLGHDIPGYEGGKRYTGETHGPIAASWLTSPLLTTVGHDGNQAQPGDLCCWQTHIGIAIGGGKMVSARSASSKPPTGINTINGDIPGEVLFVRRFKSAPKGAE